MDSDIDINATKKWIKQVVIDCNFCPFAAQVFLQNKIEYTWLNEVDIDVCKQQLLLEFLKLDDNINIETSFLLLPAYNYSFDLFLDIIAQAETLLIKNEYEGIYQIASFHPLYQFEGADNNDPANYTNRSPVAMLHILRETSIDKVLDKYKNPELIPERNITFAHKQGLAFMQQLLHNSIHTI
jgi:uncharacterized protein